MCAKRPDESPAFLFSSAAWVAVRLDDLAAGVFTSPMRMVIGILSAALLLCGCASHKAPAPKPAKEKSTAGKAVITPDLRPAGKVAMVTALGRFAVITYPPGALPSPGRNLNVYRNGQKVGEVKITGPERDNDTVADILAGEVQVNDEIREK